MQTTFTAPQADADTVTATLEGLADAAVQLKANAEANGYGEVTLEAAVSTLLEGLADREPELAVKLLARFAAQAPEGLPEELVQAARH